MTTRRRADVSARVEAKLKEKKILVKEARKRRAGRALIYKHPPRRRVKTLIVFLAYRAAVLI
jgi:hypothetical protein